MYGGGIVCWDGNGLWGWGVFVWLKGHRSGESPVVMGLGEGRGLGGVIGAVYDLV